MVKRLMLVGYGNVGEALIKLLSETDPTGQKFVISGIATRRKGIVEFGNSPPPFALERLKKISKGSKAQATPNDIIDWLKNSEYDVLVETTESNYRDARPALDYISTALKKGKDVVTANKAPIAMALDNLRAISARTKAELRFESTVMDGTPIFSLFEKAIPSVKIKRIRGVLNSTSNIILDFLRQGRSFKEGLTKAKMMGITESDPQLDLNGFDAAAKLIILSNALNKSKIKMEDVMVQPLSEQTYEAAKKLSTVRGPGTVLRQVAVADFDKKIFRVGLEALKQDDLLYSCSGSSNIVALSLDLFTELVIASKNPVLRDTAFGIYSDLSHIHLKGQRLPIS